MTAFGRLIAVAAFFFTAACGGDPGQDFAMPAEDVYSRLRTLDLGDDADSATYMFGKHTTNSGDEEEKSVTWKYKGKEILIAHLTPRDEQTTNVRLELPAMKAGAGIMMPGLAKTLMAERVASHIERRPFNDKKIMDGLYAGSMVPKEIQAAGLEAQREYARTRRELDDMDDRSSSKSTSTYVSTRSASAPTTDLSAYEERR